MKISLIAAIDNKNGIGKNGKLLWHIPKDLKWMKQKTLNHVILMGKASYYDIISYTKGKPLPNRTNVILTTSTISPIHPEFIIVNSIEEFLEKFKQEEKVFIIGGGNVYKQFIDIADELIITHVDGDFSADTFFPNINMNLFEKTEAIDDEENGIKFTFTTYKRRTK